MLFVVDLFRCARKNKSSA